VTHLEISLRQLQYFEAAAQHGNLKTAAATLCVSASSLSLGVAHLEKITGRQLFHRRHARGIVLTDDGKELLLEARNILQQVYDLQRPSFARPHDIVANINLGCLFSLSPFILPTLIKEFGKNYPSVEVHIFESHGEELPAGLHSGMYDLIISYDTDMPNALNIMPIKALPARALLSASHPLASKSAVMLKQLADEPFIFVGYAHTRDYFVSVFSECGVPQPTVYQRVQSYELVRNLVGQGLGYSIVNICPPFGNDPTHEVVAVPIADAATVPHLIVANLRGSRMNRVLSAFVDTTREVVDSVQLLHENY